MNKINATFIKTEHILLWSARCGEKWLLRREPLAKYVHMDPIVFEKRERIYLYIYVDKDELQKE